MRVIKDANARKNEIMDTAAKLFAEKGYDNTSTNDILEAVGIARGTLYHHFKSKEDIMDGMIVRQGEEILTAAKKAAFDKSLPVFERLTKVILALNVNERTGSGKAMINHLHQPQNALMHQKTNQMLIKQIPPILTIVVEDGIAEGLFKTDYPLECMELAFIYIKTISDGGVCNFTKEQSIARINAFVFNMEKILGAKPGALHFLFNLFEGGFQ